MSSSRSGRLHGLLALLLAQALVAGCSALHAMAPLHSRAGSIPILAEDTGTLVCSVPFRNGLTVGNIVSEDANLRNLTATKRTLIKRKTDDSWILIDASQGKPGCDDTLLTTDQIVLKERLLSSDDFPKCRKINSPVERLRECLLPWAK